MIKNLINKLFFKEITISFNSPLTIQETTEILKINLKPLQDKASHQYKEKALFGYINEQNECYITTQTLDTRQKLYFKGAIESIDIHCQLYGVLEKINYLLMYNFSLILFILILSIFHDGDVWGVFFTLAIFSTTAIINILFSRFGYREDFNFIISQLNLLLKSETPLIPLRPT